MRKSYSSFEVGTKLTDLYLLLHFREFEFKLRLEEMALIPY